MAPHDQVRLILNSHQLDKPISLRFLAAVERVVQSNEQFTLDDSVNVNIVHAEMPYGDTIITMLLPVCQPSSLVNSTSTSARKDLIKSLTIHAGSTCASSATHRTAPSLSGSFVKTATDFSRVKNASTAIKMTPVLPNSVPCLSEMWEMPTCRRSGQH